MSERYLEAPSAQPLATSVTVLSPEAAHPRRAVASPCSHPQGIDNLLSLAGCASIAPCQASPAAARKTPTPKAGRFSMVTCRSARSGSAPASRSTSINGAGAAASSHLCRRSSAGIFYGERRTSFARPSSEQQCAPGRPACSAQL